MKPKEIARSMNLDYISRNNDLANSINDNGIDPLQHYKQAIKKPKNQLELVTITMHDLKMTLKQMKSTPSTGFDTISTKTIKEYQDVLLPLLLNLVNQTIVTNTYPKTLKTAKIIPLKKPLKDPLETSAWRPINLLPALSKLIEKTILNQVLKHLDKYNLITSLSTWLSKR